MQTTTVPAGGAAIVDFAMEVPGEFHFVDHAIFRATQKGALGTIKVEGAAVATIYNGSSAPMAH